MKYLPILAGLAISTALSTDTWANPIVFSGLSPSNIVTPVNGTPQWTSGLLDLSSDNLSIGPSSSIQLQLNLSGNVTTAPSGPNNNYGAGIIVDPSVAPNAEIFGFTYQLLENGNAVGSSFGFDLSNPFLFAVDNVGTGEGGEPVGVTFNGVDVTIYNNTLNESVSSFQVYLGVPSSVPDAASGLFLLGGALTSLSLVKRKLMA